MDIQITGWEMAYNADPAQALKEELATGPMEPYQLDTEKFNWN